jgi:hypothetical protein
MFASQRTEYTDPTPTVIKVEKAQTDSAVASAAYEFRVARAFAAHGVGPEVYATEMVVFPGDDIHSVFSAIEMEKLEDTLEGHIKQNNGTVDKDLSLSFVSMFKNFGEAGLCRDMKPINLMVTDGDDARAIDFGNGMCRLADVAPFDAPTRSVIMMAAARFVTAHWVGWAIDPVMKAKAPPDMFATIEAFQAFPSAQMKKDVLSYLLTSGTAQTMAGYTNHDAQDLMDRIEALRDSPSLEWRADLTFTPLTRLQQIQSMIPW